MYKYFKGMFNMFRRLFSRKRECPECGFQGKPRDFKRVSTKVKATPEANSSGSSGSTGSSGSSGSSGASGKKVNLEKKSSKKPAKNSSGSGGSSGSSGK